MSRGGENGASCPRPARIGKSAAVSVEKAAFRDCVDEEEDVSASSWDSWFQWTLTVFFFIGLWWTAALLIALVMKETVGSHAKHEPGPFPYPFALTCFVNFFTTPICVLLTQIWERHKPAAPHMKRTEIFKLLAIGCLQGLELGFNNKATEYLPVSMKTMMHSMFVLFVMITARLWGLERLGFLRATAASLILGGGVLQGFSAHRGSAAPSVQADHMHGALLMLLAMTLGAQRWALIQVVMHSVGTTALGQLTKFQFLARTLPVAGFVCLLGAIIFERPAFNLDALQQMEVCVSIPIVGIAVIILIISEITIVKRTSAVALQVLATLHQIPIVFVSAALFQEHISALSVAGFGFCILAAFVYAFARRREKQLSEAEQSPQSPASPGNNNNISA